MPVPLSITFIYLPQHRGSSLGPLAVSTTTTSVESLALNRGGCPSSALHSLEKDPKVATLRLPLFVLGISILLLAVASILLVRQQFVTSLIDSSIAQGMGEAKLLREVVFNDLSAARYRRAARRLDQVISGGESAVTGYRFLDEQGQTSIEDINMATLHKELQSELDGKDWSFSESRGLLQRVVLGVDPSRYLSDGPKVEFYLKHVRIAQDLSRFDVIVFGSLAAVAVAVCIQIFLVRIWLQRLFRRLTGALNNALLPSQRSPVAAGSLLNKLLPASEEATRLSETVQKWIDFERKTLADTAIARTTQALAHDVRRPFSQVRAVLSTLEQAQSVSEVNHIVASSIPEIDRAIKTVDGLLQDVMQVGAETPVLTFEDVDVCALATETLRDVLAALPRADINICIESPQDQVTASLDRQRIKRVFANLIANACEAMECRGSLWIGIKGGETQVTISIANDRSFISESDRVQLFDAFFTRGKKGGTGLGLAIAKKWVEAHGGQISCASVRNEVWPDGWVEFRFTLPGQNDKSKVAPRTGQMTTKQIHSTEFTQSGAPKKQIQSEAFDRKIIADLRSRMLGLDSPLQVVAIDDEVIYTKALKGALVSLGEELPIRFVEVDPAAATDSTLEGDLLIVDFDLGLAHATGETVIRSYRKHHGQGYVCLHSNRNDAETFRTAAAAGADTSFPKPLSDAHLVKLLELATERKLARGGDADKTDKPKAKPPMRVAHIEDSLILRLAWKKALQGVCSFRSFDSPDAFFASEKKFDVVVTDLNFENSAYTGRDVLGRVKETSPHTVTLISSNALEDWKDFDGTIDKNESRIFESILKAVDAKLM